MARNKILLLTVIAMIAFAGNSLLCRLALKNAGIDAASFTSIRIVSGALVLWLIVRLRSGEHRAAGSWRSALALFAYAAGFSFAYVSLTAATGALLLFGAVQTTMIGYGLWRGERLRKLQILGLAVALGGLFGLLLPGLSAPPLAGSMLMIGAGMAWGIYSLRGKDAGDPISATAGNFMRTVPFSLALSLALLSSAEVDQTGFWYAVSSGALTSGSGYIVWYTALRGLTATSAATVQLSVPVLAAIGGIVFLGETVSLRLLITSLAILGGVALVILDKPRAA